MPYNMQRSRASLLLPSLPVGSARLQMWQPWMGQETSTDVAIRTGGEVVPVGDPVAPHTMASAQGMPNIPVTSLCGCFKPVVSVEDDPVVRRE